MEFTAKNLIDNDEVGFDDFYDTLHEQSIGNWDNVNDRDTIYDYINDMMRDGIIVSHILVALEQDSHDYYSIWLGNSMETPEPIETKEQLAEALGLDGSETLAV